MNTSMGTSVIVVGAGLSGLATAWRLARAGAQVTLLERGDRTGGVIRSERIDGFLCEAAPNSMLLKSASAEKFLSDIGLGDKIVDANPIANKRFLVKNGRVVPLPMSLWGGVTTPLYSFGAKLRLLREPFIKPSGEDDESVASFVTRRMGWEFLDYGISSLVSGIFAGDPDRLSMRYAFPKVWNLEANYGSLIGGAIKLGRDRKRRGETPYKSRMIAFRDGIETLTRRLAADTAARITTGARLESIGQAEGRWDVRWTDASGVHQARPDKVVVSVPEPEMRGLPWAPRIADSVAKIPALTHPPVTTLVMGFRADQVDHPLDGFGMLIPHCEGRKVLGAIFSSTIFPERAPDGHVSLMIFMGGATMPDSARQTTEEAVALACGELSDLLGLRGAPVFARSVHWPAAIPQYDVGHGRFLAAIDAAEQDWPGLYFCANYRGGPGLSDCLDSAIRTADAVLTPGSTG